MLLAVLHASCVLHCRCEPAIVTVSTPDLETMNALTAAVDMDGMAHGMLVLGAVEGTQSQVVDVAAPYLVTAVQSVPTLSLIDGVSFDNETAVWTIGFETMQVDATAAEQINSYVRLLYLTRNETERLTQGDTRNPCLQRNTSLAACRRGLEQRYVLLGQMDAAPGAALQRPVECGEACSVNATLESTPGSALQTLTLSIRHEDIRKRFGLLAPRVSPLYGSSLTIDFGIGMVFVPVANSDDTGAPANNILIFNRFSIVENTFEQVAIVKQSSYSIATHVSFWTAMARQDARVRLATIEYLLDFGHARERDGSRQRKHGGRRLHRHARDRRGGLR